ncbi:MAG: ABC transporter ATP-binding protein [Ardenticatenia bacterium]|nr:MAG: ABC transporter ATP-binding protein [Ardenticatenia bacterium]
MLVVEDLYVGYYKDLNILQGVNMQARRGHITAILGANGVGKSTLLKAIFGFLRPNAGRILLNGENIIPVPTHKRILLGLAYIPQHLSIFRWMSVEENILLGGWTFRNDKARLQQKLEENFERFPILREKRKQAVGELSGGQQRMVELARTLMTDPDVILVDEPTAGLAKLLKREVYEMLRDLRDRDGKSIILVDQEIRHALRIADYVYILDLGRNKREGPTHEIVADLKEAFWI